MTNSLHRRRFAGSHIGLLLPGLVVLQVVLQPLIADDSVETSDIIECRLIAAKAERLLCYDTIADGGIFTQKKLQQVQKERFGNKEKESAPSVDQVSVTIVRIQKASSGTHFFYTADGSVWKQSGKGSWSLAVPFQAQIKAGALGSYFLVAESGKSTRVKRVQ